MPSSADHTDPPALAAPPVRPQPPTGLSAHEWEAWKAAAHRRQTDQWSEQPGECLKCGLPMRLHPPERSYAAELWMCAKAREASDGI